MSRFVEFELTVLDPKDENVPLSLGEVELVAAGIGRVVRDVQLGLISPYAARPRSQAFDSGVGRDWQDWRLRSLTWARLPDGLW